MRVGDVVVPFEKYRLRDAVSLYTHAIVVQESPLVLVSDCGTMRWDNVSEHDVYALCQAHPDVVKRCMRRFKRDQHGPDYGTNSMWGHED